MLPSFLIIGAQKCGTTSLYHYLDEHPDVFMSPLKEPHFFAWEGREFDLAGPRATDGAWQIVSTLAEYEALFSGATSERARGEASSGYLQSPHAAEAMQRHVPGVRLIAIFRNPIRRAHSAFLHARRQGIEPLDDFGAAVAAERSRRGGRWTGLVHYVSAGMYASELGPYLEHFPAEQIRLYLNDDLHRDPAGLIRDVYEFVGVDPDFVPRLEEQHNTGRAVRSPAVDLFVRRSGLADLGRRTLPEGLARRLYGRLNERTPDPIAPDLLADLVERFRPEVDRLSEIMDRDLTPWLRLEPVPPPTGPGGGRHPAAARPS